MYTCIRIYMYTYIHIYIQTDRQTDRQTYRHPHRRVHSHEQEAGQENNHTPTLRWRHILKSQHIVALYSEYARASRFQNVANFVHAPVPHCCLFDRSLRLKHILKSQRIVTLYSEYARAQTFENVSTWPCALEAHSHKSAYSDFV